MTVHQMWIFFLFSINAFNIESLVGWTNIEPYKSVRLFLISIKSSLRITSSSVSCNEKDKQRQMLSLGRLIEVFRVLISFSFYMNRDDYLPVSRRPSTVEVYRHSS